MRIALLLVAACGSDLTADQACTQLAQVRCSQLQTCSAADLARRWPDLATCEARDKLACTDSLAAKATAASPSSAEKCGAALAAQSCDAFLAAVPPPADCLPQLGAGAT